jgi:hypothetical protein
MSDKPDCKPEWCPWDDDPTNDNGWYDRKEMDAYIEKQTEDRDHWYNKFANLETSRASCCVAMEEENKKLADELEQLREASEDLFGYLQFCHGDDEDNN